MPGAVLARGTPLDRLKVVPHDCGGALDDVRRFISPAPLSRPELINLIIKRFLNVSE